jgi:tRNA pseudouridine55 synthase
MTCVNGEGAPSGILNINKPRGWTSHDVVAKTRRLTGQRRVGHAGTLDPLATGVLLLCIGVATRVAEYLVASKKRYRCTLRLGITTDTYDADGQVTKDAGAITTECSDIEALLPSFVGEIAQVPPMYSALKRGGRPLYELARQGKSVPREPRTVLIHSIDLVELAGPSLTLDIVSSPGTYIRSLAHDLGERLGCGAHVTALTRLASGRFTLADAIDMDALSAAAAANRWMDMLLPMDQALVGMEPVCLDATDMRHILHGRPIACPHPPSAPLGRAYGTDGRLMAILAYDRETSRWRPRKVFARP